MKTANVLRAMSIVAAPLLTCSRAGAFEYFPTLFTGGIYSGTSAAMPPPGIYTFDRVGYLASNFVGPITTAIGTGTQYRATVGSAGFVFVPGWSFLGGTYDAVLVQAYYGHSINAPFDSQVSGLYNTYIAPIELSWKFGDSGFFAKAGMGMFVPDGEIRGANGFGSAGAPYWTFSPALTLSYFKDGWNISGTAYAELNTANTYTGYRTGTIFHTDLTVTKTFDKWTVGPIANYMGQVSDDKSSAYYNYTIPLANRYNKVAVGGLVAYNFGVASLSVWATKDVLATTSGATPVNGVDLSGVTKGMTAVATLSYRIWGPDQDNTQPPKRQMLFRK